MGYKVEGSLQDINGKVWTKAGDFGLVVIGRSASLEIEVDFTTTSEYMIELLVATVLCSVHDTDPEIAKRAILVYLEKIGREAQKN
jgi:hypothetical protein